MFIKCVFIFFLFFSPYAHSMNMEDDARTNVRLYGNSVKTMEATGVHSQRYGGTLMLKTPLPYSSSALRKRLGYGLDINAEPDLTKKSGEVNVLQDFYSLDAFMEFNCVFLFRFSVLAGPGVFLSVTKAHVLNTKETHTEYSGVANAGFSLDYAINKQWEVGWHIRGRYRFAHEKLDWFQGFGLIFNF